MEKGFGWHYPTGADNANSPWNQTDHYEGCPQNEDAPRRCKTCGCAEQYHGPHSKQPCLLAHCDKDICEGFIEDEDPDCTCSDIADDIESDKSDAAEARWEARREGDI